MQVTEALERRVGVRQHELVRADTSADGCSEPARDTCLGGGISRIPAKQLLISVATAVRNGHANIAPAVELCRLGTRLSPMVRSLTGRGLLQK